MILLDTKGFGLVIPAIYEVKGLNEKFLHILILIRYLLHKGIWNVFLDLASDFLIVFG